MVQKYWERNDIKGAIGMTEKMSDNAVSIHLCLFPNLPLSWMTTLHAFVYITVSIAHSQCDTYMCINICVNVARLCGHSVL